MLKSDKNNTRDEMAECKSLFKQNLKRLINSGLLEESKRLIKESADLFPEYDLDICSMKAVIAIMENRYYDAERILNEGLAVNSCNYDLLYNLGYLYQCIKQPEKALMYYKNAIDRIPVTESKQELESLIYELDKEIALKIKPASGFKGADDSTGNLRFSIIIPTRQRHETLKYALQTCIDQEFDSYEIIVSDNCSSPETKQVVDGFDSEKIRYIRADKALSMSDNWDLAVSFAKGEYLIIIGDDDGLLPYSLRELDHVIKQTGSKVIRWDTVIYNWPNSNFKNNANLMSIPLSRKAKNYNSSQVISRVINQEALYTELPMLYNSAVHRDYLDEVYKKTGRIFKSLSPDIYSGFVIAYLCREYISLNCPMSIGGVSGKSNGVAAVHNVKRNEVVDDFFKLNEAANIDWNSKVPGFAAISTAVMNSFYDAKDNIFPLDFSFKIDDEKILKWYLNEIIIKLLKISDINEREKEWHEYATLVKSKYSFDYNIRNLFDKIYPAAYPQKWFENNYVKEQNNRIVGYYSGNLILDADEFGVTDVYGAAVLCEKILGYKRFGIAWDQ